MNQVQNELMHYGVLGMHWGKHKAEAKAWGKEAGTQAKNSMRHPILSAKANYGSQKATLTSGSTKDKLRRALLYQNTNDLKDINKRTAAMIANKKAGSKKAAPKTVDSKSVAVGKSIVHGMIIGTLAGMTVGALTKNVRAGQIASNATFVVSGKRHYDRSRQGK